jgi:hypothetical protein
MLSNPSQVLKAKYHVKQNKVDWERQMLHVLSHMQQADLKKEWHKCKTGGLFVGRNQCEGRKSKEGVNMINVLPMHVWR